MSDSESGSERGLELRDHGFIWVCVWYISPTPVWMFSCRGNLVINKIVGNVYYRLFPQKPFLFNKFV